MKFTTHHASIIGRTIFGILCAASSLICIIAALVMLSTAGGISNNHKYTEMKYQEYLIKNPGIKIFIGDKQLTQYRNEKFNKPIVLKMVTAGGQSYESFVDNTKAEVIGDKLLASVGGN